MSATRLGVETHVVTAATSFVENVVKCVQRARVQIEELVAEPLASGLAVLTDAERQLGVLLADIGGGTTDTTIFSGGTVTHTRIIPVGGNHVTADLGLAFRLAPEDAEKAKIESGAARFEDVEPTEYVEIRMIGEEQPREIPRRLLTEIIRPRMEQIFCLLRDHVDAAAADGIHVTSVVITGGGSQLPGAVELGQQILELPVRIGRPRELIDSRGLAVSPACATAAGLLVYAAERMQGMKRRREPRSLPAAAMRLLLGWIRGLRRR
jgi:cell division protein FtsA